MFIWTGVLDLHTNISVKTDNDAKVGFVVDYNSLDSIVQGRDQWWCRRVVEIADGMEIFEKGVKCASCL